MGGVWLCFCRGHTKKRNRMVNLAQQRERGGGTNTNELMSMLFLLLSPYMVALLCDLQQLMSVKSHVKWMTMMQILPNRALTTHLHSNSMEYLEPKAHCIRMLMWQGCISE